MTLWEKVADLPLVIADYGLERLERDVSSDFLRVSTVIRLRGGGTDGVGEDVTYDAVDHDRLQEAGPVLPLAGKWTVGSFSEHLAGLDLWPVTPEREASRHYRVWGYESAALDLALRQAGVPLHEVLGRDPQPVTFVVSLRLGTPPTFEPVGGRLELYPTLRFKLDPVPEWDDALVARLLETGATDSLDLKGLYAGSVVDNSADPAFYARMLEAFADAWIEDPRINDETLAVLEPHRDRITWDANIHGIADIEALLWPPKMVNIKPSRLGGLKHLLDAYDYCEERGIGMYGGGQFELGPGRGQIQALASLFHPDGPNDTAPGGFNAPVPEPGLPSSPLAVAVHPSGFRWG